MYIQNNLYICSVKLLETEVKMARKKENIEDNSIKMKELTKAEEQVMQVIWNIGQGFANEIMAAFPEPKPAYNTVLSIIKILENKGFVKHETFCRAHRYSPAISKEDYSQRYLGSVVERYFNNSYLDLVSAFAKKENFSIEELEEMKKAIDEAITAEKK